MSKYTDLKNLGALLCTVLFACSSTAQQLDPTKPLIPPVMDAASAVKGANTTQQLTLESILVQNRKKNAIINGKLLKVGDKLGEYTLNKIDLNSVSLKSASNSITLSLFTGVLKTTQ